MGLTAASTRHSARGMATMHATLVRGGFGMEGLHFAAAVLVLMAAITYATTPDSLVVKDPALCGSAGADGGHYLRHNAR